MLLVSMNKLLGGKKKVEREPEDGKEKESSLEDKKSGEIMQKVKNIRIKC